MRVFCLVLALIAFATAVNYIDVNPTNGANEAFKSIMQNLKAGDVLRFAPGYYTISSKLSVNLQGTAANPIVIQGAGQYQSIITRPNANQNTIDITGNYFTFTNIGFQGGSKGVRIGEAGDVSNGQFINVAVWNTADTGFTCNDGTRTYDSLTLRNVEVYNTGNGASECFYLGCNYAACTFKNGIVEYNYCHNTTLATTGSLGSGIQLKTGSFNNIIRHNVVKDVRGAGILAYDDYDLGVNQIYGNFIFNSQDNGIQVSAGARVYNNIIVNSGGNGIRIQANQVQSGKTPRNIIVAHNTLYTDGASSAGIKVDAGSNFQVKNNAIFWPNAGSNVFDFRASGMDVAANGYNGDAGYPSGVFPIGAYDSETQASSGNWNFYPSSASALLNAGVAAGIINDFNCNVRNANTPTVGAYEMSTSTNPGVPPAFAFKPTCVASNPNPPPSPSPSPVPVDCVWGAWAYGACSAYCGSGSQSRHRDQTAAQNGGAACAGNSDETVSCFQACDVTYKWTFTSGDYQSDVNQKVATIIAATPSLSVSGQDVSPSGSSYVVTVALTTGPAPQTAAATQDSSVAYDSSSTGTNPNMKWINLAGGCAVGIVLTVLVVLAIYKIRESSANKEELAQRA